MSYLQYFLENCTNKNSPQIKEEQNFLDIKIQGLCFDMCPKEEAKMRIENNLVHILEVVGKEKKLIKSFTRSAAADFKLCDPSYLRPFPVLVKTLEYLMFDVLNRKDISHGVLYSFVEDRLRSIRQDMVVQSLPHDECRILLEPMIRFYIYFGYRLDGKDIHNCDPVLNNKFLIECLKQFLKLDVANSQGDIQELFSNLDLSGKKTLPYNYVLMESLYILCNVGEVQPLYRYLSLPKQLRCEPNLKLAYQIGINCYLGNFVKMFRLARRLSSLGYCAFYVNLPRLQRQALQVLSDAYSSKQLWVPSEVVGHYVYLHDREVALVCAHYGLTVCDGKVNFNKIDFHIATQLHRPIKRVETTFNQILSSKRILGISTS